ncbi:MAG: BON domain-containing protein [Bdellovibrionota bacterium]
MKTDSQIQKDVMDELKWNPGIASANVGVSVADGVVTLSGAVPSYSQKFVAEESALKMAGVKAVVEKLEVKLPGAHMRGDEEIARAALNALKWDIEVPDEKIKVEVEKGHVSLTGEAEWEYQKTAAEKAIRNLTGVTWVTNSIAIRPRVSPANIKEKIEQALKRAAERDAHRISIAVDGGKVTLSGRVHSFKEAIDAKGAAWSAPGVYAVESKIQVVA